MVARKISISTPPQDFCETSRYENIDAINVHGTHIPKPIDSASEAILALKPVTFHYKNQDTNKAENTPQFGLIAEDVAEVNPDLVVRDANGEIYTVRYDAVNALLLNEFLREHRAFAEEQHKVKKLEATVADLIATVKEQAAQIQKVSAKLELNDSASRTLVENP